MKKFLKLSTLVSILFFSLAANADEVKIGKKSYTNTSAVGFGAEDYVVIAIGDSTSASDVTTALVFYIPREIFANGTYDLVSLASEVDSIDEAVNQCEEAEENGGENIITLPDANKVYLVGSSTKIKQKGKFFTGKGLVVADKSFKNAQVTISGIGSAETAPIIENVTLTVDGEKLPVFRVNYKVFISEDCQEIANKSKFKASKKAKRTKVSVDVTATVVTGAIPGFSL